ncbi:MAG: SLBB domain-containing protein [Pirellulales bacterium]|nr:SLBB domain-containing protein [Pirellulales bacterium]
MMQAAVEGLISRMAHDSMKHLASRKRDRRAAFGLLIFSIGWIIVAAGCSGRVFRASELPAEYSAPRVARLDPAQLARLATPTNATDIISWGDLLKIEIDAGLEDLKPREVTVRVAKDGTVGVPLVGRIRVAGLEVEMAEAAIVQAARARDIFPNPFVSLHIEELRQNHVTVVGAVEEPGVYELPRGASSLLAGIVAAGGISDSASGEMEIRHTDPRLVRSGVMHADAQGRPMSGTQLASHMTVSPAGGGVVHVNLLEPGGWEHGSRVLEDGDVVNVIKRDLPPIHVMGLVNKPGAFDLTANHEVRLLDALALAGGCSSQVADKVVVVRRTPDQSSSISISASVQKAIEGPDNLLLAPGDTVIVRQTPETVVVETLQSLVRFGISGSVPLF